MLINILQLFIVGTLGMLGSDDVLACFIAGNVFTWEQVPLHDLHKVNLD